MYKIYVFKTPNEHVLSRARRPFAGSNEWDLNAIRLILPQYEETIRRIIPSELQAPDDRVWLPNASGEYSTKSGYAMAKLCNGTREDRTFDWNKCIWRVDTSPKIQHFLWKANSRALATGAVLQSRGMAANPCCKRCGALETELHVFLLCPFAAKVWELVPSMFKPEAENIETMASLLQHCRKMISLPPSGLGNTPLYPWILWVLWTNRNKFLFEDKAFSEQDSVLKILQDARAWRAAQTSVAKPSLPQCVVQKSLTKSLTPFLLSPTALSYTWTAFSDAAWDATTGNCGLGWLLRDSDNSMAESSSSYRRFVPSALVAEALAVKAVISAARSSHVSSIRVCSDSKILINLLKTHGQEVALMGVLHDIRVLARSFSSISFIHVPRLANMEADSYAKAALFSLSSSATL